MWRPNGQPFALGVPGCRADHIGVARERQQCLSLQIPEPVVPFLRALIPPTRQEILTAGMKPDRVLDPVSRMLECPYGLKGCMPPGGDTNAVGLGTLAVITSQSGR